ncbi:CoA-binding protein [Kineosporia sp. A_224]|uniref:CoA-binding protein n=1 Tax=Kineosporia sp. A_224 TaxID=1962180 RepID=UPI0018E981AA|nr:CoA-binding protein [Kineosporia sp. A_224]
MAAAARVALIGSGVLTLLLGLLVWTGRADWLIGIHGGLAFVLVFSLWTLAVVAVASRVSIAVVGSAVAWGLAAVVLGGAQEDLLTGGWHWTIQVLHLLVGVGVIGWGLVLSRLLHQGRPMQPRPTRPAGSTTRDGRAGRAGGAGTVGQREAAARFLAVKRVAVTGVSRTPAGHGANAVYQRLRERGYDVFAVNPNAERVEGDPCYPDLGSIPGGVGAVVIGTSPAAAPATVEQCVELGIGLVWMHRLYGAGSVSDDATRYGRDHGVMVIDGGCPLMFDPTGDPGHQLLRRMATATGKAPRRVEAGAEAITGGGPGQGPGQASQAPDLTGGQVDRGPGGGGDR